MTKISNLNSNTTQILHRLCEIKSSTEENNIMQLHHIYICLKVQYSYTFDQIMFVVENS